MTAYYKINTIEVPVKLGVFDNEKKRMVTIPVDVEYMLEDATKGAQSDKIEDTIDYGEVCEAVMAAASGKQFDLLESMVGKIYDAVAKTLPDHTPLRVTALKEILPLPYVRDGVRYSFTKNPEKF